MPRRRDLLHGLAGAAAFGAAPARAQASFDRPIRVLVGYPPGGASDLTIRTLSNGVTEQLGQSLVIENRSGASGGIALTATARAPADGYTFCVAAEGALYRTLLRDDLGYHMRELAPVAMLVSQPIVIVAHPALGVRSLTDLIALARSRRLPLPYVVAGTGGTQTFAATVMAERLGFTMEPISYRGGGQAINDLIGGQVQVGVLGTPPVMGHVREGRLRVLAVASPRRISALPDVPTIAEAARLDGYAFEQWQGVFAPRDTPPAMVARMSEALAAAMRRDDARNTLLGLGLEPVGEDPATFARRLEREGKLWAEEGARLGLGG